MGGSCSICRQPALPNPIITHNSSPPPLPSSLSLQKPSPTPEDEYSQYLSLNKALLFRGLSDIRTIANKDYTFEGQTDLTGAKAGKGIIKLAFGTVYMGDWKDNRINGRGMVSFSGKEHYEGQFFNNMMQGEGVYIDPRGMRFEGGWLNGFPDGVGNENHTEGDRFEGQYSFGRKTGRGRVFFFDGSLFEGEFKDDDIDGEGTLVWPKGERKVYRGCWKNNRMNGRGLMVWLDKGKLYYGHYLNNKKDGLGLFCWGTRKKWVGYWKDGLREGAGVLVTGEERQRGVWKMGERVEGEAEEGMYSQIETFYLKSLKELGFFEK